MAYSTRSCTHSKCIDDIREGNVICIDCGLVRDNIYDTTWTSKFEFDTQNFWKDKIEDILERLFLPSCYLKPIFLAFLQYSFQPSYLGVNGGTNSSKFGFQVPLRVL